MQSASRKEYDIEQIPVYLDQIKEESRNDNYHYQTISEVEEYVYQVLHRHRQLNNKDRKDASLEDLMAVTATEHSQDLTNKIRQLIYMDNQNRDFYSDDGSQTDGMPSIIQETKNFANMFFNVKDLNEESGSDNLDDKKIKKIEFSQSFKNEKLDKSLPFTHDKIDRIVFQDSMKNKEFNIDDAKKLLKKVVQNRNYQQNTILSEQSFEDPGIYTDRRAQEMSSLPSTIDGHFNNIKVELQNNNAPRQHIDKQQKKNNIDHIDNKNLFEKLMNESKENLNDTVKRQPQQNQKARQQEIPVSVKHKSEKQSKAVSKKPSNNLSKQTSAQKKPQNLKQIEVFDSSQESHKNSSLFNKVVLTKVQQDSQDDYTQIDKRVKKQGLRRDQSQPSLNHNPSQINLAIKLRSKIDLLNNQNDQYQNISQSQSQQLLSQQSQQVQSQQQIQTYQQEVEKLFKNVHTSKKQNPLQQQFNSKPAKMVNDSYIFEDKISQDEEAIVIKNKNANKQKQLLSSQVKIKKEDQSLLFENHNDQQNITKKQRVESVGNQLSQSKQHSKKPSQHAQLYSDFINKYIASANNQAKTNNGEGMKRSKSSNGFNTGQTKSIQSRKNSAVKREQMGSNNKLVENYQQQQNSMQRSKSTKKHTNMNGTPGGNEMHRYQSVKRLIIME
eukprot:403363003